MPEKKLNFPYSFETPQTGSDEGSTLLICYVVTTDKILRRFGRFHIPQYEGN
jgi:hypothetical protein